MYDLGTCAVVGDLLCEGCDDDDFSDRPAL